MGNSKFLFRLAALSAVASLAIVASATTPWLDVADRGGTVYNDYKCYMTSRAWPPGFCGCVPAAQPYDFCPNGLPSIGFSAVPDWTCTTYPQYTCDLDSSGQNCRGDAPVSRVMNCSPCNCNGPPCPRPACIPTDKKSDVGCGSKPIPTCTTGEM